MNQELMGVFNEDEARGFMTGLETVEFIIQKRVFCI